MKGAAVGVFAWAWLGWLGSFAVVEAVALIRGRDETLSDHTRMWFRTRTRAGRFAFAVSWVGFAVWFLVHIL